ncbi:MAG: tetratricopeptide repeat protein [Treponema sp.]|jgi:outer membrane protein assembly factor BamD (BamD/ComL family)|nr:tetratricopeptide repeat protein [Treponema sp.]
MIKKHTVCGALAGAGLLVLLAAAACSSGPAVIPEGLSPAELVQRGQEASDRGRYKAAVRYYEAILERFPNDTDSLCAAEYEIAFIHYKQKKFDEARREFNALLNRYKGPNGEFLPAQFGILARKVLERMPAPKAPSEGE